MYYHLKFSDAFAVLHLIWLRQGLAGEKPSKYTIEAQDNQCSVLPTDTRADEELEKQLQMLGLDYEMRDNSVVLSPSTV